MSCDLISTLCPDLFADEEEEEEAHHLSCPMQDATGTRSADCATCVKAAMTAVSCTLTLPNGNIGGAFP
jgi:hypothetical protein